MRQKVTVVIQCVCLSACLSVDNIYGTGLETCQVSALKVSVQYEFAKQPIRVTGIRMSRVKILLPLHVGYSFYS